MVCGNIYLGHRECAWVRRSRANCRQKGRTRHESQLTSMEAARSENRDNLASLSGVDIVRIVTCPSIRLSIYLSIMGKVYKMKAFFWYLREQSFILSITEYIGHRIMGHMTLWDICLTLLQCDSRKQDELCVTWLESCWVPKSLLWWWPWQLPTVPICEV